MREAPPEGVLDELRQRLTPESLTPLRRFANHDAELAATSLLVDFRQMAETERLVADYGANDEVFDLMWVAVLPAADARMGFCERLH